MTSVPVRRSPYVIAIHGGAAVLQRADMTAARRRGYGDGLRRALQAGEAVLRSGGPALEAVELAVVALEENPLFNAGRGASLTADGRAEMDAAIMDGATLRAGAVTHIRRVRNPVRLARHLLQHSPHVFVGGAEAEVLARRAGLPMAPPAHFITPYRRRYLAAVRRLLRKTGGYGTQAHPLPLELEEPVFGTVGAVALDTAGDLAAASSTGGMTAKHPGRIGDTPVIGAGTYADNATCAVSATGHGEAFLRAVLAYDVAARMSYGGADLATAASGAMRSRLTRVGGAGGFIAVDRRGAVVMPFNTLGMYRGVARAGRGGRVWIY
jgi:beta-aspartyl-peptidase (threonine type)